MIGKFEVCQASKDHIMRMADVEGAMDELQINHDALFGLISAMISAREPDENAKSKEAAYQAGVMDGFILGVRAQCSETVVICESCGEGTLRDPDPVPDDYDPTVHTFVCFSCKVDAQARLN